MSTPLISRFCRHAAPVWLLSATLACAQAPAPPAPAAEAKDADTANSLGHAHYKSGKRATLDNLVHIDMRDKRCTPPQLFVQLGKKVMFVVSNKDTVERDFVLGVTPSTLGPNAMTLAAGSTRTLTWKFVQAGEVPFNCNAPGKDEKDMKGVITVRTIYPWEE